MFSLASKEDMPEIVDISKAIFYTAGNNVTIRPDDITPDQVEDFNSPKHIHLYIMS
jgi:hypothetical protein